MIGRVVYERLSARYAIDPEDFVAPRLRGVSLFEFIVAVMLSQNTSDVNAWRAYTKLKRGLGEIEPRRILERPVEEIAGLIREAGMHLQRASRIKELAERFLSVDVDREVSRVLGERGVEAAREYLMELPGVGPKTADVVLLMYYGAPTFPVDTHILRVTSRMGFVKRRDYEETRRFWMENTPPDLYLPLHLLLIEHGRETCKAREPRCRECPVRDLCATGSAR